jgi:hypothetical protein
MVNKKVVVSKINAVGAIRQNSLSAKSSDQTGLGITTAISCSLEFDNKTTYMQEKIWSLSLNDYLYPPYVECDYVV